MTYKQIETLTKNVSVSITVRVKGLEPIRTKAPDPKSGLATNYNTPALQPQIYNLISFFPKLKSLTAAETAADFEPALDAEGGRKKDCGLKV